MNGSRDMELSLLDIGDQAYLAIWEMKLMPLIAKFSPVTESEGGGGGGGEVVCSKQRVALQGVT